MLLHGWLLFTNFLTVFVLCEWTVQLPFLFKQYLENSLTDWTLLYPFLFKVFLNILGSDIFEHSNISINKLGQLCVYAHNWNVHSAGGHRIPHLWTRLFSYKHVSVLLGCYIMLSFVIFSLAVLCNCCAQFRCVFFLLYTQKHSCTPHTKGFVFISVTYMLTLSVYHLFLLKKNLWGIIARICIYFNRILYCIII